MEKYMIDTHAHLDHIEDLNGALQRATDAGVSGIVAMSMDFHSCQKNLEIKRHVDSLNIYLAMGLHPSEASLEECDRCIDFINSHIEDICAIGEVGLDFWYKDVRKNEDKKNEQRQCYHKFLTVAQSLDLPVVVHSRGAWREAFEMAKSLNVLKVVFHWYDGPVDVLKDIMDYGYFVSATPNIGYNENAIRAISEANMGQLLIETDSPVYFKNRKTDEGFVSEPKDVMKTLQGYCRLMGLDEQEALCILNTNAENFFGLKGK